MGRYYSKKRNASKLSKTITRARSRCCILICRIIASDMPSIDNKHNSKAIQINHWLRIDIRRARWDKRSTKDGCNKTVKILFSLNMLIMDSILHSEFKK